MTLKEKLDSCLCEQGFGLTHMGNDFLRYDNVGINQDNLLLETDTIIIKNKDKDIPYKDYWVMTYKQFENSDEKIPTYLSKDILELIKLIVSTFIILN